MRNRRNYYRILQVQPDAAHDVIRASYRTLMQKLRMHPDLGGDAQHAALINEAYRVLCDAKLRERYDAQTFSGQRSANAVSVNDKSALSPKSTSTHCPFCRAACAAPGELRCGQCATPLAMNGLQGVQAVTDQRHLPRLARAVPLRCLRQWPDPAPLNAVVEDLSPLGMRFISDEPLAVGNRIRLDCELLDAAATVLAVHRHAHSRWLTRCRYLSVLFHTRKGAFVQSSV